MSPEAQRISIAEACGWKGPTHPDVAIVTKNWSTRDSHKHVMRPDGLVTGLYEVPDYLNDLNAMHEAEATLSDQEIDRYRTDLWKCVGNDGYNFEPCAPQIRLRRFISATAAQRAEAFLRTIGRWDDSK